MNSSNGLSFSTHAGRAYEQLRDLIVCGELIPGARLARRPLSRSLGCSPIPLTEALIRLEQDGLVESQPMFGSRVVPLSIETVRQDLILREALECQAARQCAAAIDQAGLDQLRECAAQLDAAIVEADRYSKSRMRQHMDFHLRIAEAGEATGLAGELERVWLRRMMRLCWINVTTHAPPPRWHEQLVDAIATGDPDAAERAMRQHTQLNQTEMLEAVRANEM